MWRVTCTGQISTTGGNFGIGVRRFDNRATLMTSNRSVEDWGKLLQDVLTAGAILDRFFHHAAKLPPPAVIWGSECKTRAADFVQRRA